MRTFQSPLGLAIENSSTGCHPALRRVFLHVKQLRSSLKSSSIFILHSFYFYPNYFTFCCRFPIQERPALAPTPPPKALKLALWFVSQLRNMITYSALHFYGQICKTHDQIVMFEKLLAKQGLSLYRLQSLIALAQTGSIAKAAQGDPNRQSQYSRQN